MSEGCVRIWPFSLRRLPPPHFDSVIYLPFLDVTFRNFPCSLFLVFLQGIVIVIMNSLLQVHTIKHGVNRYTCQHVGKNSHQHSLIPGVTDVELIGYSCKLITPSLYIIGKLLFNNV